MEEAIVGDKSFFKASFCWKEDIFTAIHTRNQTMFQSNLLLNSCHQHWWSQSYLQVEDSKLLNIMYKGSWNVFNLCFFTTKSWHHYISIANGWPFIQIAECIQQLLSGVLEQQRNPQRGIYFNCDLCVGKSWLELGCHWVMMSRRTYWFWLEGKWLGEETVSRV